MAAQFEVAGESFKTYFTAKNYCNSLLAGVTKFNIARLQRVQNTLARAVLRRGKYEHITPALRELHWLPVEHRITYKLATLAFKIKSSGQPMYLRELLTKVLSKLAVLT